MEYPKGAIKSIAEFQALGLDGKFSIWEASWKFKLCNKQDVTGNIITKKRPNGYEYVGYELQHTLMNIPSCLDTHLLPQDYNDWFLFANEDDAREYCAEGVTATTTGD